VQASRKRVCCQPKQFPEPRHLIQMLRQLLVIKPRAQTEIRRYDRTLAMLRGNDAFAFKLQVGSLDRNHADLKRYRELANRGNFLSSGPVTDCHSLLDLFHDLQVQRSSIGLRDQQVTVHINILSIHSYKNLSSFFQHTADHLTSAFLLTSPLVASELIPIFQEEYSALRPRAPMPPFNIRFRKFVSLNTTIRLREDQIHVSLSDLLEGAPESVHRAIAHILLAKLYKKPIDRAQNHRYKRFATSAAVMQQTELTRSRRGSKRYLGPHGRYYNLEEVFDVLNTRFFNGLMGRPQLTWSEALAKRLLGHYDPAHNTIVVSRVFDRPSSPRYAIEYLLYHEMLHLKHPVKMNGTRRCVHSAAFKADERQFPQLKEALAFLKRL
jgi:hypothetical protein